MRGTAGAHGRQGRGERCFTKAPCARHSSHNSPLSVLITVGTMSLLLLPLLPEQTLSPTAPVAVVDKMRIIRRRCLLLQVSLKAWQSPTLGGPLISAFETL